MKYRLLAAAIAVAALLALPGVASADTYWINQRTAERLVKDAAEARYSGNDVIASDSACRPQGYTQWRRYSGYWHRWTCYWEGTDTDGADVYGFFRITGHTGSRYGYKPVLGGMRWD